MFMDADEAFQQINLVYINLVSGFTFEVFLFVSTCEMAATDNRSDHMTVL